MRLTTRDMEIIKSVFNFGCLTTSQICLLLDWHIKICQRRLRLLHKEDYLRKILLPISGQGRSPYVHYIGQRAADQLNIEPTKPRVNYQLTHSMKNADLLIQVSISFKGSDITCQILPEHLIRTSGHTELIPDGVFMLKRQGKQALFIIENDSNTEIIKSPGFNEDIENKIIRYQELFRNNDTRFFENYFESEFNRFRLLFIVSNFQRLSSISKIIKEHDSDGFIWLTTLNNFNKKGVNQNIWLVPGINKFNVSII